MTLGPGELLAAVLAIGVLVAGIDHRRQAAERERAHRWWRESLRGDSRLREEEQ